jgi:Protein of unknown function (DUF3179)
MLDRFDMIYGLHSVAVTRSLAISPRFDGRFLSGAHHEMMTPERRSSMQEAPYAPRKARRRLAGLFLFLLVVTALAVVAIPVWLIRPFTPQTPDGLAVAYWLRRSAPWGTALAAAVALVLAAGLWRGARWWSRALLVLAFVPLLGAAWLAQQNIFEKMFAPLTGTRSVLAAQADWVAESDPVLAVALNGEAAAYPVRQVAYHHIVHDVVGGVPVAVTY